MSEIIYHEPPKRLAQLMKRSGGVAVADALRRADDGLAAMQDACIGSIGRATDRMAQALVRLRMDPRGPEPLIELYAAADEVIGLAGAAGQEDVGAGAYSLCELVDRFQGGAPVKPAAIQVHLDAFALLRRPEAETGGPRARRAVLDGLKQVVRSV